MRRAIGVALQEAALDPLMTGRELIRLQATLHGLPARRRDGAGPRRCSSASTWSTPPTARSGPTRAACAGAWTSPRRSSTSRGCCSSTSRPRGSTRSAARRSGRRSSKLNAEGTTVFLTTQYLEEADQLADRVGIIDFGRIVAEDTPGRLKAQIGHPHLEIKLLDGAVEQAQEVVARFGKPLPSRDGAVLVELERGAAEVAPVVRALDEAGLTVEALDLVEPSLDDVFLAKTGHHLEPEEAKAPEEPE